MSNIYNLNKKIRLIFIFGHNNDKYDKLWPTSLTILKIKRIEYIL